MSKLLDSTDSDGISINIKDEEEANPEYKIRKAMKKVAKSYVVMGIVILVFVLVLFILMAFCRTAISSFTVERDEISFVWLNEFFSLDLWKQWVIVAAINVLGILEMLYTLGVKRAVDYENTKWLKTWFWFELLSSVIASIGVIVLVVVFMKLSMVFGIYFAICMVLAYVYEFYVLNILYKFIRLISNENGYNYSKEKEADRVA